jgi:Mg-chelatase subunit ChlI
MNTGISSPRALLDAVAPLPVRPMRVLVAGTSGAGKTTAVRRVAALLDIRILR